MRIIHTADIQVKNRGGLYHVTNKMLRKIESILYAGNELTTYIIAGDLFEYAHVNTLNDSERKLIYNHLSRVLNLTNVVEIVLLAGNHDLLKEKKKMSSDVGDNAINIFTELMKNFDTDKANKIIYCSSSIPYYSKLSDKFAYCPYSLEDNMDVKFDTLQPDVFKIVLFHDMLKEYVDSVKLPIRKDIYKKLKSIDIFPQNSLILAGDIHKNLRFDGLSNQTFYYPGSPMQHTHAEGSYTIIGNNGSITKTAERKIVNEFIVDDNKLNDANYVLKQSDFTRSEIEIPDYITYNTLTLDAKTTYDNIVEALTTKKLFTVGYDKTIVKVKSANIFISYENEIEKLIRKQLVKSNISKILFDYEKFVDTTSTVINSTVQELVEEKKTELSSDTNNNGDILNIINSENIDNLILTDIQLKKLFDSILETQLSNIVNDDIPETELSSDIKTLFAQELTKHNTTNTRYDIVFDNIASDTGFMNLGPCDVELDYPGLIRISGTNGVGKTTLYNMIRWTITGLVFPNLTKNQYVKNNLIVFNKYKHDVDTINTGLRLKINNNIIIAERSVTRKWKNTATDENKSDLNWKDYISSVDRQFKLTIKGKTEEDEDKVYNGEQAETALNKWFGNTINTIIFMNQTSLENLLATSPAELNNLILNFIGVDYLNKLEDNLDSVKTDLLSIAKPTIDKETLRERIIDADILIKKQKDLIEQCNKNILKNQESVVKNENSLKTINNKLIDLGNVPDKIDKIKSTITTLEKNINEFVVKVVKPSVEFTDIKPVLDQQKIDSLTKETVNLKNNINTILNENTVIDANCNTIINDKVYKLIVDRKLILNANIDKYRDSIETEDKHLKNNFKLIESYYTNYITLLEKKVLEKSTLVTELTSASNQLLTKNTEYKQQIDSGVCKECNRPFETTDTTHLGKLKTKIIDNLSAIELNNSDIISYNKVIKEAKKIITSYNGYRDICLKQDINIVNNDTIKSHQKSVIENIIVILEKKINYNKLLAADLTSINNLDLIYNKIKLNDIDNVLEFPDSDIFNDSIKSLQTYKLTHKSNIEKAVLINKSIDENNLSVDTLKTTYQNALTSYNNNLEENVKINKDIDIYNKDVDIHNKKKEQYSLDLATDSAVLMELLLETLPQYNANLMARDDIDKIIAELKQIDIEETEKRNTAQLNIVTYQNNSKESTRLLNDCLLYQKNNIIWKIYSKLIKKQFKDIVFQYYRTFLNNTLNEILSDVNFKLFWNVNSELIHVSYQNAQITYQLVQQSSGMETCFLSLALVYTMHLLNVKNTISHIFIDEISGTLNEGKDLSYDAENYKELLVLILNKFTDKTIFIIDHNIDNLFESVTYEFVPGNNESTIKKII